jgi:hypothetical protein
VLVLVKRVQQVLVVVVPPGMDMAETHSLQQVEAQEVRQAVTLAVEATLHKVILVDHTEIMVTHLQAQAVAVEQVFLEAETKHQTNITAEMVAQVAVVAVVAVNLTTVAQAVALVAQQRF